MIKTTLILLLPIFTTNNDYDSDNNNNEDNDTDDHDNDKDDYNGRLMTIMIYNCGNDNDYR